MTPAQLEHLAAIQAKFGSPAAQVVLSALNLIRLHSLTSIMLRPPEILTEVFSLLTYGSLRNYATESRLDPDEFVAAASALLREDTGSSALVIDARPLSVHLGQIIPSDLTPDDSTLKQFQDLLNRVKQP